MIQSPHQHVTCLVVELILQDGSWHWSLLQAATPAMWLKANWFVIIALYDTYFIPLFEILLKLFFNNSPKSSFPCKFSSIGNRDHLFSFILEVLVYQAGKISRDMNPQFLFNYICLA